VVAALAAAGCSSAAAPARGALAGTVEAAPTCPVESVRTMCPPRPVAEALVIAVRGHDRASAHTGSDGRFRLRLTAGSYTVTAVDENGIGSTATATVRISSGKTATVTLTVDSGIR
jgi:carboxypeptidase family protein